MPIAAQCPDGSPPPCRPRVVHVSDSLIAILPFQTVGPTLAVFGEGLVYLLSFNLDGTGGLTTVQPQRAIERAAGQPSGDRAGVAAVARDLGAATAVNGSLIPTGAGRVRLIVNAIDAGRTRHRRDVSFALDGAESNVGSLADSASLILLSRLARVPLPRVAIGRRLPGSIDALRAFLAGERAVRGGRYDEADSLFEQALGFDSTFALAYYRRFVLRRLGAVGRPPPALALATRAMALSDRLSERERRFLHAARRGGAYLDSTDREERLDFVSRYPDDAEGWWWLEDWYFHVGAIYGYPLRAVVEAGDARSRTVPTCGWRTGTPSGRLDVTATPRRWGDCSTPSSDSPAILNPTSAPRIACDRWRRIPRAGSSPHCVACRSTPCSMWRSSFH